MDRGRWHLGRSGRPRPGVGLVAGRNGATAPRRRQNRIALHRTEPTAAANEGHHQQQQTPEQHRGHRRRRREPASEMPAKLPRCVRSDAKDRRCVRPFENAPRQDENGQIPRRPFRRCCLTALIHHCDVACCAAAVRYPRRTVPVPTALALPSPTRLRACRSPPCMTPGPIPWVRRRCSPARRSRRVADRRRSPSLCRRRSAGVCSGWLPWWRCSALNGYEIRTAMRRSSLVARMSGVAPKGHCDTIFPVPARK